MNEPGDSFSGGVFQSPHGLGSQPRLPNLETDLSRGARRPAFVVAKWLVQTLEFNSMANFDRECHPHFFRNERLTSRAGLLYSFAEVSHEDIYISTTRRHSRLFLSAKAWLVRVAQPGGRVAMAPRSLKADNGNGRVPKLEVRDNGLERVLSTHEFGSTRGSKL